jgi:SpoVK/Ycf46/Vps4 family AAA+-type ATPase
METQAFDLSPLHRMLLVDYNASVPSKIVHHETIEKQKVMSTADETKKHWTELVQLARLALLGKERDVQVFVRRLANRYKQQAPEVADTLGKLLREANSKGSILRGAAVESIPVDLDSRLQLARPEFPVHLDFEPHWPDAVQQALEQIVFERKKEEELYNENLHPTRTALFTGPPGVGKTLAARWVAHHLELPLIVLDLAAVMSSFLGRTGNNLRNILDYAKGIRCVLLLDEFDSIAKRRDDDADVGELKRLVTVLLQEIDHWPHTSLLIAATNHKELLDPAAWRRFEVIVDFGLPSIADVRRTVELFLGEMPYEKTWATVLTRVLHGLSFADIERTVRRAKLEAVVQSVPLEAKLKTLVQDRINSLRRTERKALALDLITAGLSQREAHDWTGVSRDTIRKYQGVKEH